MENIKNFIIGNIVALTSLLVGVYGVIYKSGSNTARQEQEIKIMHERVDKSRKLAESQNERLCQNEINIAINAQRNACNEKIATIDREYQLKLHRKAK